MKMGGRDIPDPEIPEPDFDEFGNKKVLPNIVEEYVKDGVQIQVVENFDEWSAYTKQLDRNRDQTRLEHGDIDQARLRQKNGFLNGFDFRKTRIR